jgi:hypothetical protein
VKIRLNVVDILRGKVKQDAVSSKGKTTRKANYTVNVEFSSSWPTMLLETV